MVKGSSWRGPQPGTLAAPKRKRNKFGEAYLKKVDSLYFLHCLSIKGTVNMTKIYLFCAHCCLWLFLFWCCPYSNCPTRCPQFGWAKGTGLGKDGQGIKTFVKISRRAQEEETAGIGAGVHHMTQNWTRLFNEAASRIKVDEDIRVRKHAHSYADVLTCTHPRAERCTQLQTHAHAHTQTEQKAT